ncbi:MAG: exopolysaccharide Pel transporter PelG [Hyphomicrobiaceae bacterium]
MAGIGFALRALRNQESLSAVVKASGHAAVIAAGPWLFTIVSLATITGFTEAIAGHGPLATFRAVIIYAFATSLVLTAPITIVATRLLADRLWRRDTDGVPPLMLASFLAALCVVAPGVLALTLYFHVPVRLGVALYSAASIVALIWVALAFCGAVRDYRAITYSFLAGLFVSVACATASALMGLGAEGMVWGFSAGLALTFLGLTLRVLSTFPAPTTTLVPALKELAAGHVEYRFLALGALLGTAAIWIDKWVFWFSAEGQTVDGGLIHAPLYDSAMFIASLVIIPALAQFVMKLETEFFERYQAYFGAVQDHGTIEQIEAQRQKLEGFSFESLTLIAVSQFALGAVLALSAPAIVEVLNLQFRQIAILRFGALGSVFLFIFIAATSIVVFFDRRRIYCALQGLFLVLNGGLAMLTASWGEEYYGAGYFLAAFIAAAVALVVADRTLARLNYLTFIGNNPSIKGAVRR